MKIAPRNIAHFFNQPSPACKIILIYGPDHGMVQTRKNQLIKHYLDDPDDPFARIKLDYKDIKDTPAKLGEALLSRGFGCDFSLLTLHLDSANFGKELLEIIEANNTPNILIITAGELTPASAIRKFCEKSDKAASVACYAAENRDIASSAREFISQHGYQIDQQAIALLTHRFAADHMLMLKELEKLLLYMGPNKQITANDIDTAIHDSSEASLDKICFAVAEKNVKAIDSHFTRAMAENIQTIAIIRTLMRYMTRLQQVKEKIAQGEQEMLAMKSLRPPLFFKHEAAFKNHLRLWSVEGLHKIITALNELERDTKKAKAPAELLCHRFLTIIPLAIRS